MNDLFIYGRLNKEIEKVRYDGSETESISVEIDNSTNTVSANIKDSFIDDTPTEGSNRLITSGAVYSAIVDTLNTPV